MDRDPSIPMLMFLAMCHPELVRTSSQATPLYYFLCLDYQGFGDDYPISPEVTKAQARQQDSVLSMEEWQASLEHGEAPREGLFSITTRGSSWSGACHSQCGSLRNCLDCTVNTRGHNAWKTSSRRNQYRPILDR